MPMLYIGCQNLHSRFLPRISVADLFVFKLSVLDSFFFVESLDFGFCLLNFECGAYLAINQSLV